MEPHARHGRPGRRGRRRSSPARTGGSACWSTTSSRAARRPGSPHAVTGPHVLVTGHPYVDVWQAVKPAARRHPGWPAVPRGTDWKTGVCAALRLGRARRRRPPRAGRRAQLPRPGDPADRRGGAAHRLRDRGGDAVSRCGDSGRIVHARVVIWLLGGAGAGRGRGRCRGEFVLLMLGVRRAGRGRRGRVVGAGGRRGAVFARRRGAAAARAASPCAAPLARRRRGPADSPQRTGIDGLKGRSAVVVPRRRARRAGQDRRRGVVGAVVRRAAGDRAGATGSP